MESVATLVAGATRVQRTALSLRALSRMTDGAALGEGCAGALDPEIEAFHRWYSELGRALGDGRAPPPPHERDADGRRRVLDCARRAVAEGDEGTVRPALGMLWASQHLDNLRRLEDHLVEPAAETAS